MAVKKLAVMGAAIIACLTACSSGTAPEPEKTAGEEKAASISVWAWDDNFNVKAANLAKRYYGEENPGVNVDVVSMAQADIVQKLSVAFSSSSYEGLPNIVLIEDYRIQNYLKSYPGELRDLSSIVDPAKFMDYKLKVMTDGEKIYGVPFDSGVTSLFYRTDYLEQAGYGADSLRDITWDQYIEAGKAVREATGKAMLTLDPGDLGQIRMMMQSAGAWYVKEDGKTVNIADNQALKDALSTYKQIVDSGISIQVSGWAPFVEAFQSGEVASVPTGCWIAPTVSKMADQSGKWAAATLPRMEGGKSGNYSSIGGSSWYVVDKTENADLAVDFLGKTFASNNDLMNELVEEINLVSTLRSAAEMSNYSKTNKFYGGQKIFEDFSDWTARIPAVNYGLYTYSIETIISEALQSILQGADMDLTLQNAQTQAEASVVG